MPGADRLRFRALAWTSAAFLAGVLLHVDRVPIWTTVAAIACVAWRLAASVRPIWLPGRNVRVALTLVLIAAVFTRFHTLNGLNAGTALLVVMGAMKLLETRGRRDQYIVIAAALFLLMAACLDRQSLLRVPLYLLHALLSCSALAVVAHAGEGIAGRAAVKLAGRSLLLALPLALLLFLFFPRLPAAFWVLPRGGDAVTGLGETMSPGSISQLTASYETAFRVRFEDRIPPAHELYWRGPVLHDFDGYTWRRSRGRFYRQQRLEYLGQPYRYRVALEPNSRPWWFALDTVTGAPRPGVFFTYDYQLIASEPVTELTSYDLVSHTSTRSAGALSELARRYDTALPPNRNPRSRELARSLRESAGTDAEFVSAVLDLFRTGEFEYSLTPQRLDLDSVDDFLFNTRSGFCGHYASAFVSLMRAGGVPARVVTGYLGGEWNPIGRYFIVRQSDAHSWAEVWYEGRGWTRVDPTAVVEPARLQRGIIDLLPDAVSAPARLLRDAPWLARTVQGWDALNAWWNDHVIEFDFQMQLDLLDRLGFDSPEWRHLGWVLVAGLAAWLVWIGLQIGLSARPGPPDRLGRAYVRLCRKLAHIGVPRESHQGPLAYARTVAERRPDVADAVGALLSSYADLRYGQPEPAGNSTAPRETERVLAFERAVRRLRLPSATAAGRQ